MFAEKLDFLMNLTGTLNSVLGRAAHVDASTVSRLRAEKRALPKQQTFLPLMCDYFSRAIATPYQERSAADVVCPGRAWPEERKQASRLLLQWLAEEKSPENAAVSGLMESIAGFAFQPPDTVGENRPPVFNDPGDGFFIGNEGKRKAVLRFLSAVVAAEKPRTLLLYSDETLDWLYEDATFAGQWARFMMQAIQRGNRIRIVHTVGRALEEMLEALEKWLGVYMTGAVEPYYCPRLRDGISRRTLFVAPGLAAVTASSVGAHTRDALNLYVTDALAVQALEKELLYYFELCVPLMRIFTEKDTSTLWELFRTLLCAKGDTAIVQRAPSLATLPPQVAGQLQKRCGDGSLVQRCAALAGAFQDGVADHCVYEAFTLAAADALSMPVLGFAEGGGVAYTKAEYAAHLSGVLEALRAYPNYHVLLLDAPFLPENMAIYHKVRTGTIILRTDDTPVAFAISEARMIAAIHEYLFYRLDAVQKPGYRKAVMARLTNAIQALS